MSAAIPTPTTATAATATAATATAATARATPVARTHQAPALQARDVSVSYHRIEVLRQITLDLHSGEWLGLIGPNGSGKSTLLRAAVGLVPSAGRFLVAGGHPPRSTDLSLMPQAPELPPGMTAVEYVLLGRTAHLGWLGSESPADRRIAVTVLRRLGMAAYAERPVLNLSGGEAQRVVIARALAQQAPVLLLDEPTSALDLGHQVEVLELVDELRHEEGLTVVAAMHDLGIAARYADRLALLHHGDLMAHGTPAEVLDPDLLSQVYGHPLRVHTIDGHLVVTPAPRHTPAPRPTKEER